MKKKWNELSLEEQAEMMKAAVRNGIYDLYEIRDKYNEFAEGGDQETLDTIKQNDYDFNVKDWAWRLKKLRPDTDVTEEDASYFYNNTPVTAVSGTSDTFGSFEHQGDNGKINVWTDMVPDSQYDNLRSKEARLSRIISHEFGHDFMHNMLDDTHTPEEEKRLKQAYPEEIFKGINIDELRMYNREARKRISQWDNNSIGEALDKATDRLSPNQFVDFILDNDSLSDEVRKAAKQYLKLPNGNWDRNKINLMKGTVKDVAYTPNSVVYSPNVAAFGGPIVEMAREYAKGGGIHIKPSHRGRLTELKKRTGKTEAELYRTGGPAVRKMITFARSARKWKHGLGGNLLGPGGYVRDKNGDPVAFDEEGNLIDQVTGEQGIMMPNIPEVVVIGRDFTKPYYSTKDDAESIRNVFSTIQEVADTPIMVQQNAGTVTGYNTFGQYLPKSQSTFGDQAELLFTELTAPTILSDAKGIYQVFRHPVQTARTVRSFFKEGTPVAEWAEVSNPSKALGVLKKEASPDNVSFVEMPLSKREEATQRMMEFIYGEDYQKRLQDAGLKNNWKAINDYIEQRIKGEDYFPAKEWSIIDNDPDKLGSSNVAINSDDYGVNIKQGISEEDFRKAIDHELAHWSTGNLESSKLYNSVYSQMHGVPNSEDIRKIMEYNKNVASNRSWKEFRKEFLPENTPKEILSEWEENYKYISDIQERRANAYAMMQEAQRQGLSIDQFIDKYIKNGKAVNSTPIQLEYLSYVYKPDELKKFMKKFLSAATPISIGINVDK